MAAGFLVTGLGRSGTTFLARALNTSPTWKVRHEALRPRYRVTLFRSDENPARDCLSPQEVRDWLTTRPTHYGEVNSYLRYYADSAPEATKGMVIIRDPFAIALSVHNRGGWPWFVAHAAECFRAVDRLASETRFRVVRFTDLFKSEESFDEIAAWLGVTDHQVDETFLRRKINPSPETADTLPAGRRKVIEKQAGWFFEKWFASHS